MKVRKRFQLKLLDENEDTSTLLVLGHLKNINGYIISCKVTLYMIIACSKLLSYVQVGPSNGRAQAGSLGTSGGEGPEETY